MSAVKGYRQSRKALGYMRRMISSGKWKANTRIPSINEISKKIDVSYGPIRKAIRCMVKDHTLKDYGSMGWHVQIPAKAALWTSNKKLAMAQTADNEIKLAMEIAAGAIIVQEYLLRYDRKRDKIVATNRVSGLKSRIRREELLEIIHRPLTLATVGVAAEEERRDMLKKWRKHKKYSRIAKLTRRQLRKLGI